MDYGKVKYLINGRVYNFKIIRRMDDMIIGKCSKIGNREIQLFEDYIYDPEVGMINAKKIEEIPVKYD